jgi:hypothetical protein
MMGAPIFVMWHIGLFIMWSQQVRRRNKATAEAAQIAEEIQAHPEYTPNVRQIIIPQPPKPSAARSSSNLQFADIRAQKVHRKPDVIAAAPSALPITKKSTPVLDMIAAPSVASPAQKERYIQMPQRIVEPRRAVVKARSIDGMTRAPRLVRDISSTS